MQRSVFVAFLGLLLTFHGEAFGQTPIGGTLAGDTNYAAGTYHLVSDLIVPNGVTLTLSPAAIIKSDPGRRIIVDGALAATGNAVDPIVFTEARDDSVGLPITPGPPAPGTWNGIEVRAGGSAVLEHARIRYTGNSSFLNWGIRKDGAGSLTISQSEITLGSRQGLVVTGSGGVVSVSNTLIDSNGQTGVYVEDSNATLSLVDNQITANGNGLQFGQFVGFSGALTMTGNQVTGNSLSGLYVTVLPIAGGISGNTFSGNDQNLAPIRLAPNASGTVIDASNVLDGPIRVDGGNLAAGLTSWSSPFTYRLTGEVAVPAGATLTLPPGTVVKADVGSRRLIVDGDLSAIGTGVQPIVLTEIRDDTAGGDSGFAGDPAPGAWNGIEVRDGGSAVLEHARIRYTGNSSFLNWGIRKDGAGSLTISQSEITLGSRQGLVVTGSGGVVSVSNTLIDSNGQTGVYVEDSNATLSLVDNQITANGNGLQFGQFVGFSGALTMTGNQVTGNSLSGLYVTVLPIAGGISGNTFSGNDQNLAPIRLAPNASGTVIDASNVLDGPIRVDGGNLAAGLTSWSSPFTYRLTGEVAVPAGATLTLPPGTVVKADVGSRRLIVDGDLSAIGTGVQPIVLTEIRDDTAGGDSGFAGDPAPGAWNGIEVRDGGSAVLEHARIRYTGNSSFLNWGIRKDGAGSLTISQSEITLGSRQGLVVTGSGGVVSVSNTLIDSNGQTGVYVEDSNATLSLVDNQITANGNGLQFGQFVGFSGALTMTGNQVTGNSLSGLYVTVLPIAGGISGNTFSGNDQNLAPIRLAPNASGTVIDASNVLDGPIRVDGGNLAAGLTSWSSPFTYRLTGEVAVPAGATLTLPPGTVVKADVGGRSLTVLGLLEAVGTSAEPVVFTEIRDDTVGGDSGFPGDPAPGAWNGIDIRDGGSAVLEQARIRYTGQSTFLTWAIRKFGSGDLVLLDTYIAFGSRDGVVIDGAGGSLLLQGNRIEGMGGNGMIIRNAAASIQILSNRILDNLGNGVLIEEASPLIQNSRLARNAQAGVRVSGASSAPTLTANWISGNNVGVDSYSGANPLIGGSEGSGNDLVDNTLFGVRNNDSGLVIDARFNWWGHPSGPQDPIGNPTGLGDAVSEWVDYSDFLDRSAVDGLFSDRFLSQP